MKWAVISSPQTLAEKLISAPSGAVAVISRPRHPLGRQSKTLESHSSRYSI